jgi:hypothetical protein
MAIGNINTIFSSKIQNLEKSEILIYITLLRHKNGMDRYDDK